MRNRTEPTGLPSTICTQGGTRHISFGQVRGLRVIPLAHEESKYRAWVQVGWTSDAYLADSVAFNDHKEIRPATGILKKKKEKKHL